MLNDQAVSRRNALKAVVTVCALPGLSMLAWNRSEAQQKPSKEAVNYQDTPSDGNRCDGCVHFLPGAESGQPGTCKVVAGEINPAGWCMLFAARP
jgi:hypothetical protein